MTPAIGAAAGKTGEFLMKNWKLILLVIVIFLVLWYVWKNWQTFKFYLTPRDIDYAPGETPNIPVAQQRELESLANQLYNDIYDTPISGHDTDLYEKALALTDNQLLHLARYYRKSLTHGITLYDDIDDELFVWTDVNNRILARLSKIGEVSKGD